MAWKMVEALSLDIALVPGGGGGEVHLYIICCMLIRLWLAKRLKFIAFFIRSSPLSRQLSYNLLPQVLKIYMLALPVQKTMCPGIIIRKA